MPPRPTADEAELAPAADAGASTYERDFYSWSLEQARLIRTGQLTAIDRDNVAEEIESLSREQFNKLESAIRVLLLHILKWDNQPRNRSRSWVLSIEAQRLELEDVLSDNPGLKPRIAEAIGRAYRRARIEAAQETGLDIERFPQTCPYSYDDIVSRRFSL